MKKSLSVNEAVEQLKVKVAELEDFIEAVPEYLKLKDNVQSCIKTSMCIHSIGFVTIRAGKTSVSSVDMVSRMVDNTTKSLQAVVVETILGM